MGGGRTMDPGAERYSSWEEAIKGYEREHRGAGQEAAVIARAPMATPGVQTDREMRDVEFNVGKGRRLAPVNREQNERMFSVIGMRSQQSPSSAGGEEQGGASSMMDVWIGNSLIDPKKGRKTSMVGGAPPARETDAWLGNEKVNPSKGRGHVPDPAMMKGRSSLFDHMHQKPMNPKMDEERDAWIGHPLHKTNKGRKVRRGPAETAPPRQPSLATGRRSAR